MVPILSLSRLRALSMLILAAFLWHVPWTVQAGKVSVLVICTHPDDEGIFFGGTLPYYTKVLKIPAVLVSITSGDWTPSNLTVREEELKCAARNYGFASDPVFGRFRDVPSHTMANNPYTNVLAQAPFTNRIDATWDYWADGVLQGDGRDVEAGKSRAINFVAEQIRRYQPEVIITQDYLGEYGHDNHRALAWAVTNAFYVAADPSTTATNLAGLLPWQASKLYLHLWPSNRLFHTATAYRFAELGNRTPTEVADVGLDCHVSQKQPDVASVFKTGENYDAYPSQWWGLYASTVGPDTILTTNAIEKGFTVPAGVAKGNFLEHILAAPSTNAPPVFITNQIAAQGALTSKFYTGPDLSELVTDFDLAWSEQLGFSKASGPAWLQVSADGAVSGLPSSDDVGTNVFTVRVTDQAGAFAEATMQVVVSEPLTEAGALAGWWRLDEADGTSVLDFAPPAQNGTCGTGVALNQFGAAPWTGTSALFTGTTNGKIDVAWSAELNPPVFTVACWAKVTGGAGTYRSPVSSRRDGPQSGYMLYAGNDNRWQFWTGKSNAYNRMAAGPVVNGQWTHLAGTYDGKVARFYTNGVLAVSNSVTFRANDMYPLRIGAGSSELPAGQYFFPGYVDDVRVYSIPLSATRVAALCSNAQPLAPLITQPPSIQGDTLQLKGNGFPGEEYVLLMSSDPGGIWSRVSTNFSGANGSFSFSVATQDGGPRFFRVSTAH